MFLPACLALESKSSIVASTGLQCLCLVMSLCRFQVTHFAAVLLNYTYRQRQKASYACCHVYLNRDYPAS
ncbi:hypothetical protein PVAP13_8KG399401 [Panicum virgatum]|uniref:Uncharacterized protein n=1 Tax=Panicum virgatum TaxID=38727 RepID=A0A8T0PZB2_PANVG|nr:hypothetical protein PVAP13_8KG399401 [Panicum virgatum]